MPTRKTYKLWIRTIQATPPPHLFPSVYDIFRIVQTPCTGSANNWMVSRGCMGYPDSSILLHWLTKHYSTQQQLSMNKKEKEREREWHHDYHMITAWFNYYTSSKDNKIYLCARGSHCLLLCHTHIDCSLKNAQQNIFLKGEEDKEEGESCYHGNKRDWLTSTKHPSNVSMSLVKPVMYNVRNERRS